jgi:hypothetical protein
LQQLHAGLGYGFETLLRYLEELIASLGRKTASS